MDEKLLTTREVSTLLSIPEKDIIDLASAGLLPHFKVAGEFIRFKRKEILSVKETIKKKYSLPEDKYHKIEKVKEFFYFNDFYIVCAAIITVLLWVVLKDI